MDDAAYYQAHKDDPEEWEEVAPPPILPWRVGTQVGRTIYDGTPATPEQPKGGRLIGVMDTPELAQLVVEAVNARGAGEG